MKYLLDSVILIDHFNRIPDATAYLRKNREQAAISVITRAEVLTGFALSDRKQASDFLDCFQTLEMTKAIADVAAELRHEKKWKLPDAIQAAFATYYNLKLITRNTKDFSPDQYNFVIIPYQLPTS